MSLYEGNIGGAWKAFFVVVVWLSLSVATTDARPFFWDSFFGCEKLPEGEWFGTTNMQTNPGNTTLVPQFQGPFSLTREIPYVYKGKAKLSPTEFHPNLESLPPVIPTADILMVMDPDTCAIAMSLYVTDARVNDVMILTYHTNKLYGPYMGSLDTNILTDVLSRFEAEYLGPS